MRGQEKDNKIWRLVLETFNKLNSLAFSPIDYSLIYYYFLWNLFSVLGYQPEIYNCFFCQKKLEPKRIYFSLQEGATVCNECSGKTKEAILINEGLVKVLRIILKKEWPIFRRLKIENSEKKLLKEISESYLDFVSGQNK